MAKQQKFKSKVRIVSIDLVSFNAAPDAPKGIDPRKINFQITLGFQVDPGWTSSTVLVTVEIFRDKTQKVSLGKIQTSAQYELEIGVAKDVTKSIESFPSHLLRVLVSSLVTTTRGMLVILSKGTSFEKAYLPIVNADDLIKGFKELVKTPA